MTAIDASPPSGCESENDESKAEPFSDGSGAGLLMSVRPRYAEAILAGTKTVELRRRAPKHVPPIVVIYGSGHLKSVVGVANLHAVHTSSPTEIWERFGEPSNVTRSEFDDYFNGSQHASALVLENARSADNRMPLSDLRDIGLEPPQSWRYVSREHLSRLNDALFFEGPHVHFLDWPKRSRVSALQTILTKIWQLLEQRLPGAGTGLQNPTDQRAPAPRS